MQVNILEAKNRLSELIRSLSTGQEVVIANRGKPVARLVAEGVAVDLASAGRAEGVLDWLAGHPAPPYAGRSASEIDAGVLEERIGWD